LKIGFQSVVIFSESERAELGGRPVTGSGRHMARSDAHGVPRCPPLSRSERRKPSPGNAFHFPSTSLSAPPRRCHCRRKLRLSLVPPPPHHRLSNRVHSFATVSPTLSSPPLNRPSTGEATFSTLPPQEARRSSAMLTLVVAELSSPLLLSSQ
jgi:hypothetical protein